MNGNNKTNNTSTLSVAAVIKRKYSEEEIEAIYLVKNGITMTLSNEDWEELKSTIEGKQEYLSSELEDGEYTPKTCFLYNNNPPS